MSLVEHPTGGYRFLPGISPYSCGVIAQPGYEIIQVQWFMPPAFRAGMQRVREYLRSVGRSADALCAIALRCPEPYDFDGFSLFNGEYESILLEWGVHVNGVNPVARTNVAPVLDPPAEPVVSGFSYTRPTTVPTRRPSFVVAGGGELPEGSLLRDAIVALDDISAEGLTRKVRFVVDLMGERLRWLGADWEGVTQANVYTEHALAEAWVKTLLPLVPAQGLRWLYSRPPVREIEFEMDLSGARQHLFLD